MSALNRAALGGAALLLFLGSAAFSSRAVERRGPAGLAGTRSAGTEGLLVMVSRRPGLAAGFRNLMADMVWLEAVQVSGRATMARGDYDRLGVLLNAVAGYDPRFDIPYILGGLILGESPRHAREALGILIRGRAVYPSDWRFHFYIGYTWYFSLGNPVEGGRAMAKAASLSGSPDYLPSLAARMLAEGRDPETALAFLAAMERQETDDVRREIFRRRMRDIVAERDIQALERLVAEYRRLEGRSPGSLSDLVAARLIGAVPPEPHGGRYVLLADGTVRSDAVGERLRVFRK